MTHRDSELLRKFEAYEVDAAAFGHRQHVQVAFEMLHKYSYLDACAKYANAINTIATRAGATDKFNVTITFAFLSLIAERVHSNPGLDFEAFLAENADLMAKNALDRWYSSEDLRSDFARRHFLLPRQSA